jgi:nicotinamide-nucleotide amidase
MGEELFVDSRLETELRSFFAKLGRDMPPHNLKQATLIPSAESMKNKLGTAPGWWLEKGGKVVVALPGPPRELIPMWQQEVLRRLKSKLTSDTITTRTIKTYGLSEAKVSELVMPLFRSDNPSLGIYAKSDGISLRLIAYGTNAAELLATTEQKLVEILGDHIWGRDDDNLIKVVGDLITGHNYSLGTMEDGTGGIIASMISSTEQAHHYYQGGVITKSSEAKTRLGIPHDLIRKCGSISEDLARQMALVIKETLSCDIGLSTTGITGLDTVDRASIKHAYIGIADREGTISWRQNILPHPDIARNRLATAALFRLRQRLLSKGNTTS